MIAVGPGASKDGVVTPVSVTVGDRVLLPGWGGSPIKVGEEVRSICCITDNRNTTCLKIPKSLPRSTSNASIIFPIIRHKLLLLLLQRAIRIEWSDGRLQKRGRRNDGIIVFDRIDGLGDVIDRGDGQGLPRRLDSLLPLLRVLQEASRLFAAVELAV